MKYKKFLLLLPMIALTSCGYSLSYLVEGNKYNSPVFKENRKKSAYFTFSADWRKISFAFYIFYDTMRNVLTALAGVLLLWRIHKWHTLFPTTAFPAAPVLHSAPWMRSPRAILISSLTRTSARTAVPARLPAPWAPSRSSNLL